MSTPLLIIPWLASLIFAGVLGFRLGYWWKTTELQGRHAVGNVPRHDVWDVDEEPPDERVDDAPAPPIRRLERRTRWSWYDDEPGRDDDTDVLPVVKAERRRTLPPKDPGMWRP